MDKDEAEQREADIRARWEARDLDAAATLALRRYGPEIFGFLLALHHGDEDEAADVFATFAEQLWRGLGRFGWQSSLRTWAYAIARHTSSSHRRAAQRWARRREPLSTTAAEKIAEQIRTETISYLQSQRKQAITELRKSLPPDDQQLLILRVDRDLPWLDLARVFLTSEPDAEREPSPEALNREAARLRKRFQIIKQRLLDMGKKRGLFQPGEG